MDKTQILSALKSKIGTTDTRFDITLSKFIELNKLTEVADDSLNLDQYTDNLKFMYEQAIGMANHEIAVARKSWEQANQQQPQPTTAQAQPQDDSKILALENKIAELAQQMSMSQQKAVIDGIKSSVISQGSKLKANEALWSMAVNGTDVPEGATAETLLDIVKPRYEALQKSVFGNTAAPYGSVDTDPDKSVSKEIDDFFASKK